MIFEEKPINFNSNVQIAALYGLFNEKILLLKRNLEKDVEPGKWGVIAGKLEAGETKEKAVIREAMEESNIKINPDKLKYIKEVYVKYPNFDFIFHIFRYDFETKPEVKINEESIDHKWVDVHFVEEYDLVLDEKECLDIVLRGD